jgi:hypothetical protein
MASIIALRQGPENGNGYGNEHGNHHTQARAVYDDRWRPIYEALGNFSAQRATNVEFDDASTEWVATHLASGAIIGQSRNRSEVIRQEVAWLEAHDLGRNSNQEAIPQTNPTGGRPDASFHHKENLKAVSKTALYALRHGKAQ